MKFVMAFFLLICSGFSNAQNKTITGAWEGTMKVGVSLRIVLHFTPQRDGGISAKMDSPDQGVNGIQADTAYLFSDSVFVKKASMQMQFSGKVVNDSTIHGIFQQGISIPLTLRKVESVTVIHKPQTPQPPYPYITEDVVFPGLDSSIQFGATITYPAIAPGVNYIKAPVYPVLILISGSGLQNRDSEIFNHRPFAVLADFFTRRGFMVLRYDERGIGKSTGEFAGATSDDFTNDVLAAFDFIKKHIHADSMNISLIGHSEGGLIAPRVANRRKVSSIVLLAGPGVPVIDLMTEQNKAILLSSGMNASLASTYSDLYRKVVKKLSEKKDPAKARTHAIREMKKWMKGKDSSVLAALQLHTEGNRTAYINTMAETILNPWYRYFLRYNPNKELRKLKDVHVLALNGNKDLQVVSKSNLAGMSDNLKKSKAASFRVMEIEGVNHLFQTCKRCTLTEYGELEETFSPAVLQLIAAWFDEVSPQKKSP